MCGIAGLVGPDSNASIVESMTRALAHRGPDGRAVASGANHAFGHARLAIIDLPSGDQPMLSRSARWLIAFNGEIYNYRDLRRQLEGGYPFTTQSDTEVILAAVECLGLERGLASIDGMYAIALFDRTDGKLHLVRDHFGIKPLYWAMTGGGTVAFASEIKALAAAGVAMAIDPIAVTTQLLCRFIPAPFSGREGVYKLRPGEWRTFDASGKPAGTPRRIHPDAVASGEDAGPDQTADLLAAGVRRQTVSDVPIGVLLSGGIDSALVAQHAARAAPGLQSYCVGYANDDPATEFVESSESARLVGTLHKNITIDSRDFSSALRSAIWHLEEPVATTSLVSYALLCDAVARERKVVLTGQGADEPWGGYTRHRFEALLATHRPMLQALVPVRGMFASSRPRLAEILAALDDETKRWVAYRSLFPMNQVRAVLGAEQIDGAMHRIEDALRWADAQLPRAGADSFSRLLARDAYTDLSDNLLLLGDKLSMAHGLEVRVPLLDVAYATHVLQLSPASRRDGWFKGRGKARHKDIAARSLPPDIVNRPKKGFETPMQRWLRTDFGRSLVDTVFSPSAPISRLLDVRALFGSAPDTSRAIGHEKHQQLFSLWLCNEWMALN